MDGSGRGRRATRRSVGAPHRQDDGAEALRSFGGRPLRPYPRFPSRRSRIESTRVECITRAESRGGQSAIRRRALAVLVLPPLVAAALYLPGIGRRILYQGDEARYAI